MPIFIIGDRGADAGGVSVRGGGNRALGRAIRIVSDVPTPLRKIPDMRACASEAAPSGAATRLFSRRFHATPRLRWSSAQAFPERTTARPNCPETLIAQRISGVTLLVFR